MLHEQIITGRCSRSFLRSTLLSLLGWRGHWRGRRLWRRHGVRRKRADAVTTGWHGLKGGCWHGPGSCGVHGSRREQRRRKGSCLLKLFASICKVSQELCCLPQAITRELWQSLLGVHPRAGPPPRPPSEVLSLRSPTPPFGKHRRQSRLPTPDQSSRGDTKITRSYLVL